MSKYIIDTDKYYLHEFDGALIVMMHEGKPVSVYESKDNLEELNSDYVNEHFSDLQDTAYKKGLHDGESKCGYCNEYQRGLDDAWGAARNISMLESDGGYSWKEMKRIFGTDSASEIYVHHTAAEAINKIKAYEEKQKADDEIKVGDEVIYNGTTKCIVVRTEDDERYASLIDGDGTHYSADHCECKKTGRHFDIASILEDMRND